MGLYGDVVQHGGKMNRGGSDHDSQRLSHPVRLPTGGCVIRMAQPWQSVACWINRSTGEPERRGLQDVVGPERR